MHFAWEQKEASLPQFQVLCPGDELNKRHPGGKPIDRGISTFELAKVCG